MFKAIDPAHGRNIPAGQPFARQLRRILPRIGADVREQLRAMPFARIRLDRWVQPLADLSLPHITRYTWDGGEQSARRIRRLVAEKLRNHGPAIHRQRAAGLELVARGEERRGDDGYSLSPFQPRTAGRGFPSAGLRHHGNRFRSKQATPIRLEIGFDVFNPKVSEAIRSAALSLAQSTLATATMDVGHALDRTRGELAEGLERGEGIERLNARIGQVFEDPMRAARIAQTEASRAVHAGQLLMAQESEVVDGITWLASSDACPLCLALNGKTVRLGEPFATGSGAYGTINHPPRHPFCMCSATEEIISIDQMHQRFGSGTTTTVPVATRPAVPTPKPAEPVAAPTPATTPQRIQAGHSSVSDEFKKRIDTALAAMPAKVHNAIAKAKIKVETGRVLTYVVTTPFPPRGHKAGTTWDELGGVYARDKRKIVVAENRKTADGSRVAHDNPEWILRHETGHGLDHALGDVSHSKGFAEAHQKDRERLASLSPHEQAAHAYFLQEGNAGLEEAFAETFAYLQGQGEGKIQYDMGKYFPAVTQFVRELLSNLP